MVYASSVVGNAMDFIKQYPSMTFDDYFWRYSAPMIRIMSSDGTYSTMLSEKQAKAYWAKHPKKGKIYNDASSFCNDLGMPIFNNDTGQE